MTVIIGAHLADDRYQLWSDGNITTQNGGKPSSTFVKVVKITTKVRGRKALVGVSGTPRDLTLVADVVESLISSPEPKVDDLFYRLKDKYARLGITDSDYAAIMWLPTGPDGAPQLVAIDGNMFPRAVDGSWWAEGSGGVEARAALLGLQYRDLKSAQEQWRPAWFDVDIAYQVACTMDTYCGGQRSIVEL